MKMTRFLCLFLAISLLAPMAFPCAPSFPRGYVWQESGERIFELPRMSFHHELIKILDPPKPNPAKPGNLWNHTLESDVADLRAALTNRGWTAERVDAVSNSYRTMRVAMKKHFDMSEDDTRFGKRGTISTRWIPPSARVPPGAPTPFKFEPYAILLAELPEEFVLYVQGAAAYRLENYEEAIALWSRILELGPVERQFRSTWASFMLAKATMKKNPLEAIPFFEQTRELATDGFKDTLDLATSSLGWQARVELDAADYISAMHYYAELAKSKNAKDQHLGRSSLNYVCTRLFMENLVGSEIVKDPLCRSALTTWVAARTPSSKWTKQWLEILRESGITESSERAGLLARIAYRNGDMETARQWVEHASESDVYALWVQTKLLLRAGKSDEAIEILSKLKDAFPQANGWYTYGQQYQVVPRNLVNGELGVLKLNRQDYVSALDAFVRGRLRSDAIYVAERILTLEELDTYIQEHAGDEVLKVLSPRTRGARPFSIDTLRYILARRLARAQEFEQARAYYPEYLQLDELFNSFLQVYSTSIDSGVPPEIRGKSMFDAAQLKRKYGRDLFGTSHVPGWTAAYVRNSTARHDSDWASDDEKERVSSHAPMPNKPYHYIYQAADMMWDAAELLPDNDPLTARALWYGGKWLEKRANWEQRYGPNRARYPNPPGSVPLDLSQADRFYKALVNRNRNLPYAQEADRLRWFPREPPE